MRVCFPHLHCSGSRLLYGEWALSCMWFQFLGTPQKCRLGWACVLCLPQPEQLRHPGAWRVHSPLVQCALSPPWPQSQFPCLPVCSLVGDAFSGAEFASFPSPLPPASSRGWDGPQLTNSPLELLSPSFVLWTGQQCVRLALFCRLIFSLSLAIPQFKLLSHVISLRLPSGHSGPVLSLSNAARSSPFSPHLLLVDVSIWGTFLLGVTFRHVICEFYFFFLLVMLPSEIRETSPRPAGKWVSWCLEISSIKTPFLR